MAYKNIEDKRAYEREWRRKQRAKERQQQALPLDSRNPQQGETKMSVNPSHFHKFTIIALVMALAMTAGSLWFSWQAYDMSRWILGP